VEDAAADDGSTGFLLLESKEKSKKINIYIQKKFYMNTGTRISGLDSKKKVHVTRIQRYKYNKIDREVI